MSSRCGQEGFAEDSQTELDKFSSEKETAVTAVSPMLIKQDSGSYQRAESSSSLSSSSSTSSTCSKDDKVEMTCMVKGCEKSAYKSRRYQLLPWKCKYHRNKTYKETYKRRKAMANQDPFNVEVKTPGLELPGDRLGAANRHRQGEQGSMLEQVLNEKKMALMQSPVVLEFLQKQQQKKQQQHKHQQKTWSLQQVHGYGPASHR